MAQASFAASQAMKSVTLQVRVTGVNVMRARLWLAAKVFAFGAWIAGCGIEFDTKQGDDSFIERADALIDALPR